MVRQSAPTLATRSNARASPFVGTGLTLTTRVTAAATFERGVSFDASHWLICRWPFLRIHVFHAYE